MPSLQLPRFWVLVWTRNASHLLFSCNNVPRWCNVFWVLVFNWEAAKKYSWDRNSLNTHQNTSQLNSMLPFTSLIIHSFFLTIYTKISVLQKACAAHIFYGILTEKNSTICPLYFLQNGAFCLRGANLRCYRTFSQLGPLVHMPSGCRDLHQALSNQCIICKHATVFLLWFPVALAVRITAWS